MPKMLLRVTPLAAKMYTVGDKTKQTNLKKNIFLTWKKIDKGLLNVTLLAAKIHL